MEGISEALIITSTEKLFQTRDIIMMSTEHGISTENLFPRLMNWSKKKKIIRGTNFVMHFNLYVLHLYYNHLFICYSMEYGIMTFIAISINPPRFERNWGIVLGSDMHVHD